MRFLPVLVNCVRGLDTMLSFHLSLVALVASLPSRF